MVSKPGYSTAAIQWRREFLWVSCIWEPCSHITNLLSFSCFTHSSTSLPSPLSFCFTRTLLSWCFLGPSGGGRSSPQFACKSNSSALQRAGVEGVSTSRLLSCLCICLPGFGLNKAPLDKQLHLCFRSMSHKAGKRLQLWLSFFKLG